MEALEGHFPLQFSKNETVEGSRQVCSILYFKLKMNSYELLLEDWTETKSLSLTAINNPCLSLCNSMGM